MNPIKNVDSNHVRKIITLGFWYGYSNGSIVAFVKRLFEMSKKEKLADNIRIANLGFVIPGFIPSENELTRPVDEIITEINTRRICPSPLIKNTLTALPMTKRPITNVTSMIESISPTITEEISERWLALLTMFDGTVYEEAVKVEHFVSLFSLTNRGD